MPWEQRGSGFTTARGGHVKNPAQYEKLRAKGMSKEKAAAIVNKSQFDLSEIAKKKRQDDTGAAIAGGGAAVSGVGLVGGGVPGVKSDPASIRNIKRGSTAKRIKAGAKSGRAGIFGFRADAHRSFHSQLAREQAKDRLVPDPSHIDTFTHGVTRGKIGTEKKIVRAMTMGRRGSNAALLGGAGIAAYGVHRIRNSHKVSKARSDTDRYHGAMAGGGAALAGTGYLGARKLEHEGRKWSQKSADKITEAARIAPNTGLYKKTTRNVPNKRVPDVVPEHDIGAIHRDPWSRLHGDKAVVARAGKLRGEATQARYFARTFGSSANMARKAGIGGAAVGAVGAGGLLLSRKSGRKKVHKSIEHPIEESEFSKMHTVVPLNPNTYGISHALRKVRGKDKVAKKLSDSQRNSVYAGATAGAVGVTGVALAPKAFRGASRAINYGTKATRAVAAGKNSNILKSEFAKAEKVDSHHYRKTAVKGERTHHERKLARSAAAGAVAGVGTWAPNTAAAGSGVLAGMSAKKGKRYSAGWRAGGRSSLEGSGGYLAGALAGGLATKGKPMGSHYGSKIGQAVGLGHGHYASSANSEKKGWLR